MDPASLSIGISGFALQFFIVARAGYGMIKVAKATSETASRLQILTGFEQIRFESWARIVGLSESGVHFEERLKNDKSMYYLTIQALCHVCNIVTRFNELTNKYGMQRTEQSKLAGILQLRSRDDEDDEDTGNQTVMIPNMFVDDSRTKFEDILHVYQKRLSYMQKFTWAVKDRAKYEELVNEMREMNNGLHASLPRTMQSLLGRDLVLRQPNDLSSLYEIERTMAGQGLHNNYYNAAILKRRSLEQARQEMDFLEGRDAPFSDEILRVIKLNPGSLSPAERHVTRVLKEQNGSAQTKVLVEYKFLGAADPTSGQETVLFQRLVNLIDLLRITPKPTQYRILDCKGFVRHDVNSEERYGLVFAIPPRLATQPQLHFSTLQDLLRAERDNAPPLTFFLEHRFRLAARLADSVAYMHFAGWLHRNINSENIVCFHLKDKPSIDDPFLCGFAFSRPDNPREVSEFETSTMSNLYRHPDYQMPRPTQKFRRSYDIYSLGIILVEIGFWKRIRAFRRSDLDAAAFKTHLVENIVPLLGFYMGERYKDAVLACLDVGRLNTKGDEERELSAAFSRTVVQQLQSCEII